MNIEVELWLEISYLVPINIKQLQLLILSRKSVYFQHVFYKSSRIRKSLYKYFKNIVYSNLVFCLYNAILILLNSLVENCLSANQFIAFFLPQSVEIYEELVANGLTSSCTKNWENYPENVNDGFSYS